MQWPLIVLFLEIVHCVILIRCLFMLYLALLYERRIILVSSSLDLLSASVYACRYVIITPSPCRHKIITGPYLWKLINLLFKKLTSHIWHLMCLLLTTPPPRDLLYPIWWQHVFIPILPSKLIDYVAAPMPLLIGLHRYKGKSCKNPIFPVSKFKNIRELKIKLKIRIEDKNWR